MGRFISAVEAVQAGLVATVVALLLSLVSVSTAATRPDVEMLQPLTASASKRTALVIGNASYKHVPQLRNPVNDARSLASMLQNVGFKVVLARNLDRRGMNEAIDTFLSQIEPGSEALIYYSGHGVELNGSNYLLPVDIPGLDTEQERMLRAEGVNLSDLLLDLESRSARVNLVILDACRDNPFRVADAYGRTKSLGAQRGLARVDPPKGTFVIFAAGVGEQAIDNLGQTDTSPNGLFTRKLLSVIAEPGLEIRPMVQQLRAQVREASLTGGNRGQTPSYYDQLLGEFYFLPKSMEPDAPTETAGLCKQLVNPQAAASEIIGKDLDPGLQACAKALTEQPDELQFARLLQAAQEQSVLQKALRSPDPNLSNAYLILYPNGRFTSDVKTHLASLRPAEEPIPIDPIPTPAIDPLEIARVLQTELKRVGCTSGTSDGLWGPGSKRAMANFNRLTGAKLDTTQATTEAIEKVRSSGSRVCPLECGKGYFEQNGKCQIVAVKREDRPRRIQPVKPVYRSTPNQGRCATVGGQAFCQ